MDPYLPPAIATPVITSETAEVQHLSDQIAAIAQRMQTLQEAFDSKIKYDATKDRQIETLHADLMEQREGMHWRILRPIFADLITLYDDLSLHYENLEGRESPEVEAKAGTIKLIKNIREMVIEILGRNGVALFTSQDDVFSVETQRAVRTVSTTDATKVGRVAQRLRPGFRYEQRILRPEWVITYQS